MHYFQFNIKDYAFASMRLTLLEDLAFRRMLDLHYDTEKPLPNCVKKIGKLIGMRDQTDEITEVLNEFWLSNDEGFYNERATKEIIIYQAKADVARANGKKGGRPVKPRENPPITQSVNLANPEISESKANYELLTKNYKPLTNNYSLKASSNELDQPVKKPSGLIFDHWSFVMDKNKTTKFTAQRKKAIESRLKNGYSVNDIFLAITNCAKSKFHMGDNNDGKLYNDLTLICRNDTKLESFRDMTNTSKADFQLNKDRQDINDFVNGHD